MSRRLDLRFSAICAALVLALVPPAFAQTKPAALVGVSRSEIIARLGEPKSNIKAGSRELLFFAHLKLTLKNDVIVEAEELPDEPAPRRAAEPAPTTAVGAPAAAGAAPGSNPTPPNAATVSTAPLTTTAPVATDAPNAKAAADAAAATATKPTPPAPQLEIKFIKPGAAAAKSAPRAAPSPTGNPAPLAAGEPKPAPPAAVTAPVAKSAAPAPEAKPSPAGAEPTANPVASSTPAATEESPEDLVAPAKPAVDPRKKAAIRHRWRLRRDAETEEDSVSYFSAQSYVLAAILLIGGVGYLWWRRVQRNLELAATSVSHTPFVATAADTTGQFSADLIGKLGAKKFERLVASYYAKTGVVAERTHAAPGTPVHIKIFWKGEPKPFAGVQCHANPPSLIGPKPLQELFEALSAAEIRRGYIVTTGKFNVEARDYAEEKNFTLLSGDIFLEKLNALPPAARGELLKETNTEEPAVPAAGGAAT